MPALADRDDDYRGDRHHAVHPVYRRAVPVWRGHIEEFEIHDRPHWESGYWRHGIHDGRDGWWWVVAGLWYFYPEVIRPYPDPYTPPVVVVQPPAPREPAAPVTPLPAPTQNWYYCASAKSYYPYVPTCPEEWQVVPATPPR